MANTTNDYEARARELLVSADRPDAAVKAAEARADTLLAQPADPFDGLSLDEQWATA